MPATGNRLRDLAARARAEMALALMLSWYKDAHVKKIDGGFRAGANLAVLRQAHPELRGSAIKIADYVDPDEVLTDSESVGTPDAEGPMLPPAGAGTGSSSTPPPPPEASVGQDAPHGKGPAA